MQGIKLNHVSKRGHRGSHIEWLSLDLVISSNAFINYSASILKAAIENDFCEVIVFTQPQTIIYSHFQLFDRDATTGDTDSKLGGRNSRQLADDKFIAFSWATTFIIIESAEFVFIRIVLAINTTGPGNSLFRKRDQSLLKQMMN